MSQTQREGKGVRRTGRQKASANIEHRGQSASERGQGRSKIPHQLTQNEKLFAKIRILFFGQLSANWWPQQCAAQGGSDGGDQHRWEGQAPAEQGKADHPQAQTCQEDATLVLITPGLALFYGSLTRAQSVLNTMMMRVVSIDLVGVLWMLASYSTAFGGGGNAFFGSLANIWPSSCSGRCGPY